jgi:tRNA(fMet)-specific endonuclease VapC
LSYLLDTNTWIALFRWQNAGVLAHLQQRPPSEILLCSVVLAELWFGVERSDAAHRVSNLKLVDELVAKYETATFDNAAARDYATIRAHLFASGQPIGPNDMLIAAIARSRNATLVTNNVAEFSRVPGLLIESWQSP